MSLDGDDRLGLLIGHGALNGSRVAVEGSGKPGQLRRDFRGLVAHFVGDAGRERCKGIKRSKVFAGIQPELGGQIRKGGHGRRSERRQRRALVEQVFYSGQQVLQFVQIDFIDRLAILELTRQRRQLFKQCREFGAQFGNQFRPGERVG